MKKTLSVLILAFSFLSAQLFADTKYFGNQDLTQIGSVGIGTAVSGTVLDVSGSGSNGAARVTSTDDTGTQTTLLIRNHSGASGLPIITFQKGVSDTLMGNIIGYHQNAFGLVKGLNCDVASGFACGFRVNNAEIARIDSTGLGVGKIPSVPLDIVGEADIQGTLKLVGASSGFVGFAPAAAAGSTTYTLPSADGASGQSLTTSGAGVLSWSNALQSGTGTLTAGAQTITANISVNSRILVTFKDPSPGAGSLTTSISAPSAGRSVGTPGSFAVQANLADGSINVLDTSTFDWEVIN